MPYKSAMRPAYATAETRACANGSSSSLKDIFAFSAAQTEEDDYNAFGSRSERKKLAGATENTGAGRNAGANERPKARPVPPSGKRPEGSRPSGGAPQKRKKKSRLGRQISAYIKGMSPRFIVLAASGLLALLIIIILGVLILSSPTKGIEMKDNAFFAYTDSSGKHHVVVNGSNLKQTFNGEIELIPAKNNAFAYVFEQCSDENGDYEKMYVVEGKKITEVVGRCTARIVCADYSPAIVYKEGNTIQYFSKNNSTYITGDSSAKNFVISGNGDVVIYTQKSNKPGQSTDTKYFSVDGINTIDQHNFIPRGISFDGKYVYGTAPDNTLYCLTVEKEGKDVELKPITTAAHGTFKELTGINSKGTEIIFTCEKAVNSEDAAGTQSKSVTSYIFDVKNKKMTEARQIAPGTFTPIQTNKKIATPSTFAKTYFECSLTTTDENGKAKTTTSTYFLDKSGAARKLADAKGKFSPDGKYFYYTDAAAGNSLCKVSLSSSNFSESREELAGTISDFVVTENGKIYYTFKNNNFESVFFLGGNRISHQTDPGSMVVCGSTVFFSETVDGTTKIYRSTNGSAKTVATFKNGTPSATPILEMGAKRKGYAYFTDVNGNVNLYYTSNAKSFSLIDTACTINGYNEE